VTRERERSEQAWRLSFKVVLEGCASVDSKQNEPTLDTFPNLFAPSAACITSADGPEAVEGPDAVCVIVCPVRLQSIVSNGLDRVELE